MANRLKSGRSSCSTLSYVHVLLVFISASLAGDITDEIVFPEQYNSSFPAYENSTSALGNRRRTSRWRTTDPGLTTPAATTTTTLYDEQHGLLPNIAPVPVTLFRGEGPPVSVATVRSPQSGDVAQQSWTIRPRPRTISGDLRDAVTTAGSSWTSRTLAVGSESPVEQGRQRKTSEVVMKITKGDGEESLPDSLLHTTDASDLTYTKTYEQEDDTDYVRDYNDRGKNDDGEDVGDDNDEDDEEYDDYDDDDDDDDDDKRDFYDYDDDYDEDNRRHIDSEGYDGGEYPDGDSDGDNGRHYARDGNMRMPINYTGDYDYEPDYPLHMAKNHHHPDISDPGSREIRRLVMNSKSSNHIDMSLLVIYAWLGLVIIMIAITVLIFKYKQQLSARCLKVTSSCRKVRQVIGIEEGNNLLAHPLV